MSWKDRVSFMLTDTLQIKKISFLDLAFEGRDTPEKDEAFDADAALATGELCKLIPELIDGLGGEHDFFAAGAALAALPAAESMSASASLASNASTATPLETAPWD
jgi:recombination associated protein RdgC